MSRFAKLRPSDIGRRPRVTAGKVLATKSYVRRVVGSKIETKSFVGFSISSVSVSFDVPIMQQVSDVVTGDINLTRDGDVIDPTMLELRYDLLPTDATESVIARIICFQWMADADDDTPTGNDVLNSAGAASDINQATETGGAGNKIRILYDRRHAMGTTNAGNLQYTLGFIRVPGKRMARIYFDGTASKKGHIFVFATSNMNAANNEPIMRLNGNLKFKDI